MSELPAVPAATDELKELCALDGAGWLAAAGESAASWRARAGVARAAFRDWEGRLENGENLEFAPGVCAGRAERIPPAELGAATAFTAARYGFAAPEGLGFYLSRGIGFFCGGCAFFDPEKNTRFFLLNAAFRHREKYLGLYSRSEIVTHELCHMARAPLADAEFEEYFAYQCSPSRLRRYLGNCFVRPLDAFLFVLPALLLAASRLVSCFTGFGLPGWVWWAAELPALAGAGWLLWRNQRARNRVAAAAANLRAAGVAMPEAVLFRCTAAEIHALAALPGPGDCRAFAAARAAAEPRWRVITARFFAN